MLREPKGKKSPVTDHVDHTVSGSDDIAAVRVHIGALLRSWALPVKVGGSQLDGHQLGFFGLCISDSSSVLAYENASDLRLVGQHSYMAAARMNRHHLLRTSLRLQGALRSGLGERPG